ncbi:acyl-CoA synthetase [Natrinema caseinilyticum]|uniref:acyl-CoA synthetase n=1 Tax=Natrinema caseinilyticum TaxID=2961570 RepID=UPI0020C4534A|nr:AMP-binding protein [Natrinema caseinilyticum]
MTDDVPSVGELTPYHFHEREWESYEALRDEFEWEIPDRMNMAQYVCDRHATDEDTAGLIYEDSHGREGQYTFAEMKAVTDRLANYLTGAGLARGDRVAICVPQKPETALSHIAIWKTGGVSVPLSTLFGPDALRYRLDNSDAKMVIVDETNVENLREVKDDLDQLEEILVVGDTELESDESSFWTALRESAAEFQPARTTAEDDAVIIYTSGTTGDPKGVVHAHRMLLGQLPGFVCLFCNARLEDDDVFWVVADWAWKGSLFDFVFPALFYGKPVLAYEEHGSFDPETAFTLVERHDLTSLYIPPTALRRMMNEVGDPEERYDPRSVRVLGSGGEALGKTLPRWVEDVLGATVHEGYGQTEASPLVGNCVEYFEYKRNIGKPLPGIELDVLDVNDRTSVSAGETGEIAVKSNSPNLFKSYWRNPEKTESKFYGDWMLTEDLAVKTEDGYLDFVSRKDDVIISSGYRIGPEEVEDAIAKHEAIADAGVIGVSDENRGNIVKAYVTVTKGYEPSDDLRRAVQSFVKDNLARYKYPREIEFIDELPKSTTGKIRRSSLQEMEEKSR